MLMLASPLYAEELPAIDEGTPAVVAAAETVARDDPAPAETPATIAGDTPAQSAKPDVEFVWTQFLATSIRDGVDDDLQYGGRFDVFAKVPGSSVGLDDSVTINIHPEFRYGNTVNGEIGLLAPQAGLFYPAEDGEEFDLSLSITKRWKSGAALEVGKVNVADFAAGFPVVGGGTIDGFSNLAFALPPSTVVPVELVGALLTVPTRKVIYRVWVYDPVSATQRHGFEDPFGQGIGGLVSVTFPVRLRGNPGYYAIKLAGTTRRGTPVEVLPPVLHPLPGGTFGRSKGQGSAVLAAYQFLDTYEDHPGKGWGFFGQVYISEGDPTPLDVSGFLGIAGNLPFRPQDNFGLAWFRYSLSDGLADDLSPFIAFEDEEGVEAFYTFEVDKPLRVTASVQYIDGAIATRRPGWVVGLRTVTRF